MKALAKAILNLAATIELTSDDLIDPDFAVKALEQLGADLKEASPAEIAYLKAVITQEGVDVWEERTPEQQARREFLLDFMENLGLE